MNIVSRSCAKMFSNTIVYCAIWDYVTTRCVTSSKKLVMLLSPLTSFQVPRAQKANWKTLGLLTYRVGLLIVWTIFALPGTILNGPIFILASILSRQKAKGRFHAHLTKSSSHQSCRGTCCFHGQAQRAGCPRNLEGSHLTRCCACVVSAICLPCDSHCDPCECDNEMENHDPAYRFHGIAFHEYCCIKIW